MMERVLIVDDSLTVRMDLAEAFEGAGFAPTTCESVKEARAHLASKPTALVVLDVLLPDGDGIDLLREIRAGSGHDVAVMLLSTEAEVRDRIRGLTTGADEYIGKPYERSYVVSRARELLRKGRPDHADRSTILVVDDSESVREELCTGLTTAGYRVVQASTGEEGLRLAADVRPAAIIVDGTLPGIDGATVIRRLRFDAALRRIPCVLLTASTDRGAELLALESGADAFIRKHEDFVVVLARLRALLRAARSADLVSAESMLGPRKILAVDDSDTYLRELGEALREDGYDVVLAHSGEDALELLAVERVDCVLLDRMMPGLDGEETCRRIKAAPAVRNVPVVLLTALEDSGAMVRGLAAGADDFITKSGDFSVIRARVRALLRRRQLEEESRRFREHVLRMEMEVAATMAARELAETRAALVRELEHKNRELEAFSYSVSHDLRAPLRAIVGFSQLLLEEQGGRLDERGRECLHRTYDAARRMNELIDDLLELSRVARAEMRREAVDLSKIAQTVVDTLRRAAPDRQVRIHIEGGLHAEADPRLMRIVLENLLGNAWKFTAKTVDPFIELSSTTVDGNLAYVVRDNGAGFDMKYAGKLFAPFQRLHREADFPGTGVGLATVQRIIDRHSGRVWAEAAPGKGAAFYFTLTRGDRDGLPAAATADRRS